jgi:hypothetical protein
MTNNLLGTNIKSKFLGGYLPLFKDVIIEKFHEYGFDTIKDYEAKDGNRKGYYIHMSECIFFVEEKDKQVSIAFDVATLPDVAAKIVTLLHDIKDVNYVSIMENYFMKDGKFFSGEQAIVCFRSYLAERECKLNDLMKDMKFFNC